MGVFVIYKSDRIKLFLRMVYTNKTPGDLKIYILARQINDVGF